MLFFFVLGFRIQADTKLGYLYSSPANINFLLPSIQLWAGICRTLPTGCSPSYFPIILEEICRLESEFTVVILHQCTQGSHIEQSHLRVLITLIICKEFHFSTSGHTRQKFLSKSEVYSLNSNKIKR